MKNTGQIQKGKQHEKLTAILIGAAAMIAFSGTVAANPNQIKGDISHCGCNEDGTGLVWMTINVNKKRAYGHLNIHGPGSEETCYDEYMEPVGTYVRGYRDCEHAYNTAFPNCTPRTGSCEMPE